MTFEDKFKHYAVNSGLLSDGEKVLLAVSGGVDSMVMMHLFAKAGFKAGVAHCNFGLRGEESLEDEKLVEQVAAELGMEHYNMRFDTAQEMETTGENVQLAARRLRYGWFNELCQTYGYEAVAIAHHADDSIETFFINLLRGTGLKGLTGIHKTRDKIVRPILFASRREILDYAHSNKIAYREDSSNRSTKYLRNKIRLGISPMMREIAPKFTNIMVANLHRLSETQEFITSCMERVKSDIMSREGEVYKIDVAQIDKNGLPRNFVIYELMSSDFGFKGDVVDNLCESLTMGLSGRRFYSRDWVAYTDRGRVVITRIDNNDDCQQEVSDTLERIYIGGSVMWIKHTNIDNIESFTLPQNVALLDASRLKFPLQVRRWKEGDTFVPFGMDNHKKVSDFLIDEKVSMAEKQHQFVLLSGDDIVWVIGRRIDNRYRLRKDTENVLKAIVETI